MPQSKKPRRKPAGSASRLNLTSVPDVATLDPLASARDQEALSEAQDLVYEAWDLVDGRSQVALARRALKLSPYCADAWLLLAERPSLSQDDRRALLERAVKAGELALGARGFDEYEGHFWGFLETRSYMRARHGLAEDLWESGAGEEAIAHLREMLMLNPGDNQGLRYILLAWLLHMRDDAAVEEFLRQHDDEASAFMCYTQALFAFRNTGDSEEARQAAIEAWHCNRHVPRLLRRPRKVPVRDPGYYTLGGEDEAAYFLEEYGFAWKATSGAVEWLVEVTRDLKSDDRRSATVH